MTKNESKILIYLLKKRNASKIDVLNSVCFNEGSNSFVNSEDRLIALINQNLISADPVEDSLTITPSGLHELDEYLENKTRLDKLEADAAEKQKHSYIALLISASSLVISVLSLLTK